MIVNLKMNAHLMVGMSRCSFVKDFKRVCEENERVNSVKEHRKNKKRG